MDLTQYNMPEEAYEEEKPSGNIPDGKYAAECTKFEFKKWDDGNTQMSFEWIILGPTHKNLHVWQRTHLYNLDSDKMLKGEKARKKIANAIGLPVLSNSEQAVGKQATITIKAYNGKQYVVDVESYGTHSGNPTAQATMMQAPPQSNNNGGLPWAAPPQGQPQPGRYASEDF